MLTLIAQLTIGVADLAAAFLFLFGLKRMSSPATASSGIRVAGIGMIAAVAASFLYVFSLDAAAKPHLMVNLALAIVALAVGGVGAWLVGRKVAMTAMPQMIAIYNGMGGGAAGGIAAVELFGGKTHGTTQLVVTLLGALIGAVSMSGSVIAWAKLQGVLKKPHRIKGQQLLNGLFFLATVAVGGWIVLASLSGVDPTMPLAAWTYIFFGLALVFGVLMTLPIGGADMPVVISIYNAFTGLAVGLEGFVLGNPALMIAGMVVGAAGLLLTLLMAKAMNRSVANVLFSNFGDAKTKAPSRELNARWRRPTPESRCATLPASSSCRVTAWPPPKGSRSSTSSSNCFWRPRSRSASPSTPWPDACPGRWMCCWPRPACPTT
jgi:NAD(P) transhydrogenase subunit beta